VCSEADNDNDAMKPTSAGIRRDSRPWQVIRNNFT
jgi:hypothetical protein